MDVAGGVSVFIDLAHEVGDWCLSQGTHLYFWIYRMLTAWDVMEEGEVLSDADRLKMTNAILQYYPVDVGVAPFPVQNRGRRGAEPEPPELCGVEPVHGGEVFQKYYGLTDFDEEAAVSAPDAGTACPILQAE